MKRLINIFAIFSVVFAAGCGHYVAMQPAPPVVVVPVSPGPEYIWVNGSWKWSGVTRAYHWRNGYWARRRGHAAWIDGYWASTNRGLKYVPGHWH